MSDSGSTEWSPDELLPAELGAVVGSKRQSSSFVAVQTLIASFVVAHNRLVSQLVSAKHQGRHLQQDMEQLKLESHPVVTSAKVGVCVFCDLFTATERCLIVYLIVSVSLCSYIIIFCKQDVSKCNLWIFAEFLADTTYILSSKWLMFGADRIQDGWLSAIFTARRYASAVLAVIVCLSVRPSVCLSQVGVLQRWLNLGSH